MAKRVARKTQTVAEHVAQHVQQHSSEDRVRFHFERSFDFRLSGRPGNMLTYPKDFEDMIPLSHAQAAEKDGAGKRVD